MTRLSEQALSATDADRIRHRTVAWYWDNARALPWRRADCTPWGVLVSEFMLQQTPVSRVLPMWSTWMEKYPSPADLAAATSGDAVVAWGRLGYPRRAVRLHATASAIADEFDGQVPAEFDTLIRLPGIGRYTAAAVSSFAFSRAHAVLDTNIRRVIERVFAGVAQPSASPSSGEFAFAERLLPEAGPAASRWNAAVMELGALVCTARAPRCDECPLRPDCAWVRAGMPADDAPVRPKQAWHGTDRQLRGAIMAVLRSDESPVPLKAVFDAAAETSPTCRAGKTDRPGETGGSGGSGGPSDPGVSTTQTDALSRLAELAPAADRLARLIADLCADGLARRTGESLALPL